MQAPTTPSGPPAQEPGERACQHCGAANGPTSSFCWQCYRPFDGSLSPPATRYAPPAPRYAPGAPPSGWTPAPQPFETAQPSRVVRSVAVAVLATLAALGGFLFLSRGAPVELPESFGGMSAIDDAQSRFVVDAFRSQIEVAGAEGDMAMYGAGTPTTALMWIRDASVPTTDAAFDEFATGFDSGIGSQGSLDSGQKTTETFEGVTYVCAPVVSVAPGTICMWQDEDVFWLLFDFSGQQLQAGQDLAVVAHDAIAA